MTEPNQTYLVSCHKQESLREAVTLRLSRLGYKATPNQTSNSDVQFSVMDGEYSNSKSCDTLKHISIDEFFQLKDEEIRPIWIRVDCLNVGERFTQHYGRQPQQLVITNYSQEGQRLAVNPETWCTFLISRETRVQRVVCVLLGKDFSS